VLKALAFAADKHSSQRRKGYQKLPYINHPIKVAQLLSSVGREKNITLLTAALLHDVLEDTDADARCIGSTFGKEVLDIVMEVTDDMSLSYRQRKKRQIESARRLSPAAKKIRLADKICNMRDIMTYPLRWSQQRKLAYLEFAGNLAAELQGTNTRLEQIFHREHTAALRAVRAGS
jgi:guanosine-3',5'-bis(diphosphate) 3'-pyrophosphohydrolase